MVVLGVIPILLRRSIFANREDGVPRAAMEENPRPARRLAA